MPGRVYTRLFELASDQYGYLTPADLKRIGLDPKRLVDLKLRGQADRVAQGVYRLTAVPATRYDQYMEAVLWPHERGVLSHETALDLYELCDINPVRIHVTVPMRYRIVRAVPRLYVMHRRALPEEQVTSWEGLPIVTAHQALLDGIRASVRRDLVEQGIDNAEHRGMIASTQAEELRSALAIRSRA